jgi:hypothetical protein
MALRKHFIASCSLLTDNRIHVWDIDRPHIPYYSFEDHSQVTTGFLWHDSNTIWSVSKDKFFFIHRLPTPVLKPQPDSAGGAYYPAAEEGDESGTGFRPAATMSMTAVDLNVWGDLVFCIPKVAAIKPANLPEIATTMAGAQQSQLATHHSTGNTSSVAAASGRSGLAARLDSLGNNLTWGGSSVPSNIVNFLSKAAAVDDNADLSFGTIAATSGGGGDFDEE